MCSQIVRPHVVGLYKSEWTMLTVPAVSLLGCRAGTECPGPGGLLPGLPLSPHLHCAGELSGLWHLAPHSAEHTGGPLLWCGCSSNCRSVIIHWETVVQFDSSPPPPPNTHTHTHTHTHTPHPLLKKEKERKKERDVTGFMKIMKMMISCMVQFLK